MNESGCTTLGTLNFFFTDSKDCFNIIILNDRNNISLATFTLQLLLLRGVLLVLFA